jgi:hypothetical protein
MGRQLAGPGHLLNMRIIRAILSGTVDTMAGSEQRIFCLIKFFEREEWADEFIRGRIYLNRLSYFKKIEAHQENNGRPDANEAVAMWWQPHGCVIDIDIPRVGRAKLTEKDFAAPIFTSYTHHNYFHILCLHALSISGFPVVDARFQFSEGHIDELQRQVRIDRRCFRFGPFAVVMAARPFIERFEGVLRQQGRKVTEGLVEYYDDATFNGEIPHEHILFRKQNRFKYQREFRIAVEPILLGNDPLIVNIGDISHLCCKAPSDTLNESMQFKFAAQNQGSVPPPGLVSH